MILMEESSALLRIYNVLRSLGAREETVGFHYTAYGIHLAIEQPQRLAFVTKWLYPDIARRLTHQRICIYSSSRKTAVPYQRDSLPQLPLIFPPKEQLRDHIKQSRRE